MAGTPKNWNWPRLADQVVARRVALGMTRRDLSAATTVHERSIGKLERGESVSRDTVAKVERELRWAPGSGRSILEGGEAAETKPPDDRPAAVAENWDDEYVRRLWGWQLTEAQRLRLIAAYLSGRDPLTATARFTREQAEALRSAPAAYGALIESERRKRDDEESKGNGPESDDRTA